MIILHVKKADLFVLSLIVYRFKREKDLKNANYVYEKILSRAKNPYFDSFRL